MLIFRQLVDMQSSTYTYMLGDSRTHAGVIIDPVFEQVRRDAALLQELGLRLVATVDTHVHADHVTGAWLFQQRLGSRIMFGRHSGAQGADRYLKHGDRVEFGDRYLRVQETPGHTAGCLTLVMDDEKCAFTGDALLIRGTGRTDFQQGDPATLYQSVRSRIFTLPDSCLLYPAHDYRGLMVTSVAEEKRYNPRLGGELSETDFAGFMNNLGLAHPKQIEVAVPANLQCGRPGSGQVPAGDPDWAPLGYTFAGIWEIQPQWVEEHLHELQVLDVRDRVEFEGALGHIPGALHIALVELPARLAELDREIPVVSVCRAGGRSARATQILAAAGFPRVANLAGGMLRWRTHHLHVLGALD